MDSNLFFGKGENLEQKFSSFFCYIKQFVNLSNSKLLNMLISLKTFILILYIYTMENEPVIWSRIASDHIISLEKGKTPQAMNLGRSVLGGYDRQKWGREVMRYPQSVVL